MGSGISSHVFSITSRAKEGYGRFHYRDNAKFCSNARGSCAEVLDHLITANDEGLIPEDALQQGRDLVNTALRLLNGYIAYLGRAARGFVTLLNAVKTGSERPLMSCCQRSCMWLFPQRNGVSWLDSRGRVLTAAILLGLGIRLVGIALFSNWAPGVRMEEFHAIARSIASGRGFTRAYGGIPVPSAYMPPAYCYIMAALMKILGDNPKLYLTILVLQAFAGAILVIPIWWLAEMAFDRQTAAAAIALSLVYPVYQFVTADFTPFPYYVGASLVAVGGLLIAFHPGTGGSRRRAWGAIVAGVAFGVFMAFRGEAVFYLPVVLVVAWKGVRRIGMRGAGGLAAMVVVGMVSVMGAWWCRNRIVFGEFVWTPTAGKYSLYRGQNRLATGGAYGPWGGNESARLVPERPEDEGAHAFASPPEHAGWCAVTPETQRRLTALPVGRDYELERERVFFEDAVGFIQKNPGRSLQLAAIKFTYLWWRDPTHPVTHHPMYLMPWSVLLGLFILGVTVNRRRLLGDLAWMSYFVACQTGICVVFLVQPRYHLFLCPLVFIIGGNAVVTAYRWHLRIPFCGWKGLLR